MDKLVVPGNQKLKGTLRIHGAKNSALPLLAASIMTEERVEILDIPDLKDVNNMLEIIKGLGTKIKRGKRGLILETRELKSLVVPESLMKELRSSIVLLGALIARKGKAVVSYPGGCAIGPRPIELHLNNFKKLGCEIEEREDSITAVVPHGLKGADINLDYPSVGATENLMMAAVFADGVTTINNPAREPEIIDLQDFLNSMGAQIEGAGTNKIRITGVKSLKPTEYMINPDRIAAGTFMIAGAITGSNITLKNVIPEHVSVLSQCLRKAGVNIIEGEKSLTVIASERLNAIDLIETTPYPGFPTDLQPQMMALCTVLKGTGLIVENIFEGRFRHVEEFKKMGADITMGEGVAMVRGKAELTGSRVKANDLRAGAALVLAGLKAKGTTIVEGLYHIDRGYERIESQIKSLGGKVERIQNDVKYENA